MWDVLEQIWNLHWWEVLFIAIIDDFILFIKLWPVYLFFILLTVAFFIYAKLKD